MQQKLYENNMGNTGSVTLPIVDVIVEGESHLFENPSIEEVTALL
jgi:hypothetical protein